MTEQADKDRKTAEVAVNSNGTMQVLTSRLGVFHGTAALGHYRETDRIREELHADLDNVLDASIENAKNVRRTVGLE